MVLNQILPRNINPYLTLFDTQIKPILLYAWEAWSVIIKGNIDDTTLLTKNKLEKCQINIFKNLLGVSKSTSKITILLELGRYPITSYICTTKQLNILQDYHP